MKFTRIGRGLFVAKSGETFYGVGGKRGEWHLMSWSFGTASVNLGTFKTKAAAFDAAEGE